MNTLQTAWNGFFEAVIPKTASVIQVEEMQKAFYGGAASALSIMQNIAFEDVSLDVGVDVLEKLIKECENFAKGINK